MKNLFLLFLCILLTPVLTQAQWKDAGELEVWTKTQVMRVNDKVFDGELEGVNQSTVRTVRIAKNKGFDRVVIEFKGALPSYKIVYVTHKHFDNETEKEIKMRGKYLIDIVLATLYPDDREPEEPLPTAKSKWASIQEFRQVEWFEGTRVFTVSLKAKKDFRVQTLANPTRLVVDFKH
ncbi:MAG: hypothetical protein ABI954_08070 [Pyrinomonadaceae bacterium]